MVVELYQQIGSALRRYGATDDVMPTTKGGTPLKGGYHNHPCTRWVGDSRDNFRWAVQHGLALCEEFKLRYNKPHYCEDGIRMMGELADLIPQGELTEFAQAMPDECRQPNVVLAYRIYYKVDKSRFAKWDRGREAPSWW
jgi:uncharacterized protein YbaA (DUF1428 family)|tara:strand:- start:331 stop:750 length:420 start_codon:yes stop_codon:yes gene_type:complete